MFDAIEAAGITDVRVICANGKVFPMSESDIEQKIGRANLARMERLGIPFFQNDPRNAEAYTFVGVSSRGTPVWLHKAVAKCDAEDHDRPGAVQPLGRRRRRQADPPRRRLGRDDRVEPLRLRSLAADALRRLAGPMRSDIDEVATMCGLDCTMNVLLDTHGRVIDAIFGAPPGRAPARRSSASTRSTRTRTRSPSTARPTSPICGVFAPTDHLFFHTGWGCMSADFVLKDGGTLIYCSPSPGVSTAIGDFPGLALMDLMKPYMPPTRENYEQVLHDIHARTIQMWAGCIWVPIYEVMTRKHLKMVTLEENLEMAADIGIDATTSLDEAFAAAMAKHGPDAKVIVLPFARYQLPRNMIRMDAEPLRYPAHARH